MDFFETWFGIHPDHGTGSLEAVWVLAILAVLGAFLMRRRIGDHVRARVRARVRAWTRTHNRR